MFSLYVLYIKLICRNDIMSLVEYEYLKNSSVSFMSVEMLMSFLKVSKINKWKINIESSCKCHQNFSKIKKFNYSF